MQSHSWLQGSHIRCVGAASGVAHNSVVYGITHLDEVTLLTLAGCSLQHLPRQRQLHPRGHIVGC
jgi:hypothetical protein